MQVLSLPCIRMTRNLFRRCIPDAQAGSSDTERTGRGLRVQVRQAPVSLVLAEIHSVGPEVISGMKPKRYSVPENDCAECNNPDENQEEQANKACHDDSLGSHSPSGGAMSGLY